MAAAEQPPNAASMSSGDEGMGLGSDGNGEKSQQNLQERKIRREIANSNERRRMQSINAGFQSLRTLLPHHEGEKLSKAAILQQTAEYIYSLEQEKTRLLAQNCHLKRMISLAQQQGFGDATAMPAAAAAAAEETTAAAVAAADQPPTKRVKTAAPAPVVQAQPQPPPPPTVVTERVAAPPAAPRVALVTPAQIAVADGVASVNGATNFVRLDRQPETVEQQQEEKIIVGAEPNVILKPANGLPPGIKVEVLPPAQQQPAPPPPQLRLLQPEVVTVATTSQGPPAAVMNLSKEEVAGGRSYIVTGSSKQNLDSIVEAIKHLEGDHLFSPSGNSAVQQQQQQIVTTEAVPQEVVQEGIVSYTTEGGELKDSKGNSIIILKNCN